jgi:hypothetical protein
VIILVVLGIWFVGSIVFGLLAAHFLRFSDSQRQAANPEVLGPSAQYELSSLPSTKTT